MDDSAFLQPASPQKKRI